MATAGSGTILAMGKRVYHTSYPLRFDGRSRVAYVTSVAEKRKLPVLQTSSAPEPDAPEEDRPPWHWVGFGTVGIFGAWLPLMGLAQAVSSRLLASTFGTAVTPDAMRSVLAVATAETRVRIGLYLAIPHAIGLALASAAGGYLVGRYGKGLGPREAAISGVALAIVTGGLTFGAVGFTGFLAPLVLAVPFAALGGHLGKKRAPPV